MGQAIAELFSSKKFLMMLIGVIVWFAGRYGINLDPNTLYPPLALIAAAIFGQAIADHGKSAALVNAAAAAQAPPAQAPNPAPAAPTPVKAAA